jgi:hypothetical protein
MRLATSSDAPLAAAVVNGIVHSDDRAGRGVGHAVEVAVDAAFEAKDHPEKPGREPNSQIPSMLSS